MIVYRLSRQKYKAQLSGIGAALKGGRWNRKGTEVIYTASSRALAMAEVFVHFTIQDLPNDYFMLMIYVPDSTPQYHITEDQLPLHWNLFPYSQGSQNVGEKVLQKRNYGVIKVPSAVVKGCFNYLIDPAYTDFDQVKIVDEEKFPFDTRLVFST